ncbi:acyl CoA binding protein-domain-containing protein [Cokeromyces recurvatus]|uniref:acyl CoA binding protein-domain-containing protein n=1 Tax=Cokeromyces recurvatus TaxID=90255 RepID=UPI00221EBBEF|nr:acyl CoA binding protein-domain-containing protein [Cokeromyces recurvatus]KAI7902459.1 acyl CoA binding protein-domain-containing protein [Cokeromyces recurvatus]
MVVDSAYKTQMRFAHALSIVRAIPPHSTLQPVVADKLQFYGLYKQASEGDINIPKPSSRQIVDYAKWKVWSRMKGMSPIEAQKLYVDSLVQLLTHVLFEYIYIYMHIYIIYILFADLHNNSLYNVILIMNKLLSLKKLYIV